MAFIEEMDAAYVTESIRQAAQKRVPATVTVREGDGWANFLSRFLSADEQRFVLAQPVDALTGQVGALGVGDKVAVSFKLRHHKHMLSATVGAVGVSAPADQADARALSVLIPPRMQRMQRRAFIRVTVPSGRIVRAAVWPGTCDAEPAEARPDRPVWCGQVTNLSAGGFQVRVARTSPDVLDVGDAVGARIAFGVDGETVYVDARCRHALPEGDDALLGFQFMGLDQTLGGRAALALIGTKTEQFARRGGPDKRAD